MKKVCLAILCGMALSTLATTSYAIPAFRTQFEDTYLKEGGDSQFAEAVKEAKCNVCHYGKSKKNRNDYGKALSEFLKKDDYKTSRVKAKPEKVKKEIEEAFKKVEKMKSSQQETFGELIKAGKLPGTAPADAAE